MFVVIVRYSTTGQTGCLCYHYTDSLILKCQTEQFPVTVGDVYNVSAEPALQTAIIAHFTQLRKYVRRFSNNFGKYY